eukprot:6205589-Pleurochrysis_carterae.AAC.2
MASAPAEDASAFTVLNFALPPGGRSRRDLGAGVGGESTRRLLPAARRLVRAQSLAHLSELDQLAPIGGRRLLCQPGARGDGRGELRHAARCLGERGAHRPTHPPFAPPARASRAPRPPLLPLRGGGR